MTDDCDGAVIVGAFIGAVAMFFFMIFAAGSAWEESAIKAGVGRYNPTNGHLEWVNKETGQPIANAAGCTCEKK